LCIIDLNIKYKFKNLEEKTKMKRNKLLMLAIIVMMMFALTITVSARAAGPFWTIQEAVGDRNWVEERIFVDGAETPWGGGITENADNLFDGDVETKYGSNAMPFWAIWRYDQAYIADSFIFATANDNESNPRRMGNGWRVEGADGADGPWTVLYTGRGDDYDNDNFAFFRIDLPDNTQAFQYYRLYSEDSFWEEDGDAIQLSEAGITWREPPAPEPEPEIVVDESGPAGGGDQAEVAPVAPAPVAAAPVSAAPAPQTFDPLTIIVVGALASAAGVLVVKKRKR
jgi:hypothetical protein